MERINLHYIRTPDDQLPEWVEAGNPIIYEIPFPFKAKVFFRLKKDFLGNKEIVSTIDTSGKDMEILLKEIRRVTEELNTYFKIKDKNEELLVGQEERTK